MLFAIRRRSLLVTLADELNLRGVMAYRVGAVEPF